MEYQNLGRIFNGILWIVLGLLIFVWLFTNSKTIEMIIWIGFGLGCLLVGIYELQDQFSSQK